MNKKAEIQIIGLVGLLLFLGVLYTLNYELPSKNKIYLNSNGFSSIYLDLKKGDYIGIYNNDTGSRMIVIDGERPPEIKPNEMIEFRLIKTGDITIEIMDRDPPPNNHTITVHVK